MRYYPMLASTGTRELLSNPDYVFEAKLDGIRCIAEIDGYDIILWSRTGKDITEQFPDVVAALTHLAGRNVDIVLDGEIIVESALGAGLIPICDFQALQTRLQRLDNIHASMSEAPAKYVPFDLLSYEGVGQCNFPWHYRRAIMDALNHRGGIPTPTVCINNLMAEKLFDTYTQAGVEGFIAKKRDSIYKGGTRSKDWLKIKPMLDTVAWIGGITHGTGRRAPYFGGFLLGHGIPGDMIYIGTVGSGLTDAMLLEYTAAMRALWTTTCPFIGSLKIPDVKYWVLPTYRAHVKFQEWTNDRKMRFPTLITVEKL